MTFGGDKKILSATTLNFRVGGFDIVVLPCGTAPTMKSLSATVVLMLALVAPSLSLHLPSAWGTRVKTSLFGVKESDRRGFLLRTVAASLLGSAALSRSARADNFGELKCDFCATENLCPP